MSSIIFLIIMSVGIFKTTNTNEIFVYEKDITIDCSGLVDGEVILYNLSSNKEVEISNKVEQIKSSFVIKNLNKGDILSDYECRFRDGSDKTFNDSSNNTSKSIKIEKKIAPYLIKPQKLAYSISEEDRLQFECVLLFGLNLTWSWKFMNDSLNNSSNHLKISHGTNFTQLIISQTTKADNGYYICEGFNEYGTANETFELVVRSKSSNYWLYGSILVEVIVFCLLIFAYEKRKKSKEDLVMENLDLKEELIKNFHYQINIHK